MRKLQTAAAENIILEKIAERGKACDMARQKMSLDQRLNFWVSQETYDFYAQLAIKRKAKVSELLRVVLDKATELIDENGEFRAEMPMSKDDLQRMMREVAADEAAKAVRGAVPVSSERAREEASLAAENTKRRYEVRQKTATKTAVHD